MTSRAWVEGKQPGNPDRASHPWPTMCGGLAIEFVTWDSLSSSSLSESITKQRNCQSGRTPSPVLRKLELCALCALPACAAFVCAGPANAGGGGGSVASRSNLGVEATCLSGRWLHRRSTRSQTVHPSRILSRSPNVTNSGRELSRCTRPASRRIDDNADDGQYRECTAARGGDRHHHRSHRCR